MVTAYLLLATGYLLLRSMSDLWLRANQPADSEARQGLHPECDASWFASSFCSGRSLHNVKSTDPIWPYIASVKVDELIAILASHDVVRDRFFEVGVRSCADGVDHLVIQGADSIADVQLLRSFLLDCLSYALTSSSWSARRKEQETARARRRSSTDQLIAHPVDRVSRGRRRASSST